MRLAVFSDIHLETGRPFVPDGGTVEAADVVILAGDVHVHTRGILWAAKAFPGKRVVYVSGNHEYDGARMGGLLSEMRRVAREEGIDFLEGDCVEIGGVLFAGTTLWSDYCLYGQAHLETCMHAQDSMLPDFMDATVAGGHRASARHLSRLHARAREFLRRTLTAAHGKRVVAVTHHAPSAESVAPRFRGVASSASFASALGGEFLSGADLWIHGHTHHPVDYVEHGCRVFSNPVDLGPEWREQAKGVSLDIG